MLLSQIVASDNCTPANLIRENADAHSRNLVGRRAALIVVTVKDAAGNSSSGTPFVHGRGYDGPANYQCPGAGSGLS